MAAVAGLRALGIKGPIWLRRSPWASLSAGFCSPGSAGTARLESELRPTSTRQRDGIRNIVLSNPKKRNALSLAMLKSLRSDILHEAESKDLKVIIISAEGPVFSSGHDLKELTGEQGCGYHTEVFQTCSEVMTLIQNHPVPIIAMVNGLATAAGCQLVASCDIAVASDKSSFATPGVNIGLFCSTPAVALGRAVPRKCFASMDVRVPMMCNDLRSQKKDVILFKMQLKGWRDGSVVKSTGCSSRGPRFDSRPLHGN